MENFIESLKGQTVRDLNELMFHHANKGDLEKVKILLTSNEIDTHAKLSGNTDTLLIYACASGNIELVKYVLTSPELSEHPHINYDNDMALSTACKYGHLELVKYLIESPELTEHSQIPFLHRSSQNPIVLSLENNNFDLFKYLISVAKGKDERLNDYVSRATHSFASESDLSSIKNMIEVGKKYDNEILTAILEGIVHSACYTNSVEPIKYIFGSPELKQYVDIHKDNDSIFHGALTLTRRTKDIDVLQYLIFDLNITETERIKNLRSRIPREEVEKLFKLRDLSETLGKDLSLNPNTKMKKPKL